MAIVRPVDGDTGERWAAEFTIDFSGSLSQGVALSATPVIVEAVEVASNRALKCTHLCTYEIPIHGLEVTSVNGIAPHPPQEALEFRVLAQ